jgi:hypothetical protein
MDAAWASVAPAEDAGRARGTISTRSSAQGACHAIAVTQNCNTAPRRKTRQNPRAIPRLYNKCYRAVTVRERTRIFLFPCTHGDNLKGRRQRTPHRSSFPRVLSFKSTAQHIFDARIAAAGKALVNEHFKILGDTQLHGRLPVA